MYIIPGIDTWNEHLGAITDSAASGSKHLSGKKVPKSLRSQIQALAATAIAELRPLLIRRRRKVATYRVELGDPLGSEAFAELMRNLRPRELPDARGVIPTPNPVELVRGCRVLFKKLQARDPSNPLLARAWGWGDV